MQKIKAIKRFKQRRERERCGGVEREIAFCIPSSRGGMRDEGRGKKRQRKKERVRERGELLREKETAREMELYT